MGLNSNAFFSESERPLVLQEYLLVLEDSQLQGFINDSRLKGVCSRTNCEVILTKRILNRRFSNRWLKYAVVQVVGVDLKSIQKCNIILEKTFPWYVNRKEYNQRAPVRLFTSEIIPDNTDLSAPHQRTGVSEPFFHDLRIRSPHELQEEDVPFKPWLYLQRQFEGSMEPQQDSLLNYIQFRSPVMMGCAEPYTCTLTRQLVTDDTAMTTKPVAVVENEDGKTPMSNTMNMNFSQAEKVNSNSLFFSDIYYRGSLSSPSRTQTSFFTEEPRIVGSALPQKSIFRNLHNQEAVENPRQYTCLDIAPLRQRHSPGNSIMCHANHSSLEQRVNATPVLEIDKPRTGVMSLIFPPNKPRNCVMDSKEIATCSERQYHQPTFLQRLDSSKEIPESWWQNNSSSCCKEQNTTHVKQGGQVKFSFSSSYCFMKNSKTPHQYRKKNVFVSGPPKSSHSVQKRIQLL